MWEPKIDIRTNQQSPIYMRIVEALAHDVATGRLAGGAALPPHRSLAKVMGVSPGTVTRAYREAELRGLIEGHVGRGTRVHMSAPPAAGHRPASLRPDEAQGRSFAMLNLALNEPPIVPSLDRVSAAFANLGRGTGDWLDSCSYGPPTGFEAHRATLARWLTSRGLSADPYRTALCKGAQHAISLVLSACANRGDGVLVENYTYSGFRSLAEQNDLRIIPVEMDDEGMLPESLAEAASHSHAKIAYLVPTLQNPTTSVMSLKRRQDIIEVARKADLTLIEDDVYGTLVPHAPPPLAALAPDICLYVSSLSKTVCPALRTGFIVTPTNRHFSAISRRLQATMITAASFDTVVACRLIESGDADVIIDDVRKEALRRAHAAQEILGGDTVLKSTDGGFHIWLPMPFDQAEQVVSAAVLNGIAITPPSSVESQGNGLSGLRLCLGAPHFNELMAGLNTLRTLLD